MVEKYRPWTWRASGNDAALKRTMTRKDGYERASGKALHTRDVSLPWMLLYEESGYYWLGDETGTYKCKVGAQKDETITAMHWHMIGIRNPSTEKTFDCTKIPHIRGSMGWALINGGYAECFRPGAHCCVLHNVMFDRMAAEFGLDPTEVALKNNGCRGHDWVWVGVQPKSTSGACKRARL